MSRSRAMSLSALRSKALSTSPSMFRAMPRFPWHFRFQSPSRSRCLRPIAILQVRCWSCPARHSPTHSTVEELVALEAILAALTDAAVLVAASSEPALAVSDVNTLPPPPHATMKRAHATCGSRECSPIERDIARGPEDANSLLRL